VPSALAADKELGAVRAVGPVHPVAF